MLKSCWGIILLLFLSLNPKVCAQYDFLNHCENINVLNSSERESIHTLFKHYKVNTCESLEQKLEQTGYLKLSGLGLKSATFLKFFHHFIKIDLSDNRLNKLPPIKMSNLSHLWLSENELDDISVLKFIDSLELLSVSDNYIKIIPEINCEKLLALDLSRNKISSIKNLAHCRKLKFLFLKYNKIEDLSPIAYHHGSIKIKNWSKLDEFRKNEDIDWDSFSSELLGVSKDFKILAVEHNPLGRPLWQGGVAKNSLNCPRDSSFKIVRDICQDI